MIYNEKVTADAKLPEIEHNSGMVYFRFDFTTIEREDKKISWQFNQYVMTEDEFNDVRVGRYVGEWTDGLRAIQRGYLYDIADNYLARYNSDVEEPDKKAEWIQFKKEVRATPEQKEYPTTVVYPSFPE